jgi:hypothetical protein
MNYTGILVEKNDGIAWLTINRPQVRNPAPEQEQRPPLQGRGRRFEPCSVRMQTRWLCVPAPLQGRGRRFEPCSAHSFARRMPSPYGTRSIRERLGRYADRARVRRSGKAVSDPLGEVWRPVSGLRRSVDVCAPH